MPSWSNHKKSCKLINEDQAERERDRIASLERQLSVKDEQLAAKDRQLATQAQQIKLFEQLFVESFIDIKEENQQIRKRKQPPKRLHRTEPERRKIAKRQQWLCAGKECPAATHGQELEEYDVDHIVPLSLGGTEELDNLQALCPSCHRKKTDRERLLCPTST